MNRPDDMRNGLAGSDDHSAASDRRLKRAVLDASAVPGGADIEALTGAVMAQWQTTHRESPMNAAMAGAAGGLSAAPSHATAMPPAARRRRRRVWVGGVSLAAMAAVAMFVVSSRPDPALEELMQPDVLSQLAIGEM